MRRTDSDNWAWRCQECGRKFRSVRAAQRAAFGDEGCPGCGGSDIDYSPPVHQTRRRWTGRRWWIEAEA